MLSIESHNRVKLQLGQCERVTNKSVLIEVLLSCFGCWSRVPGHDLDRSRLAMELSDEKYIISTLGETSVLAPYRQTIIRDYEVL